MPSRSLSLLAPSPVVRVSFYQPGAAHSAAIQSPSQSVPAPRPAPATPRAGEWAAGVLPGDGGRPRQDGGPLGAQLLGRWLGAPFGAQRVPGGDGEAASRAGAREDWTGSLRAPLGTDGRTDGRAGGLPASLHSGRPGRAFSEHARPPGLRRLTSPGARSLRVPGRGWGRGAGTRAASESPCRLLSLKCLLANSVSGVCQVFGRTLESQCHR